MLFWKIEPPLRIITSAIPSYPLKIWRDINETHHCKIGILVIVGVLAWQIGSKLSADAIGMGVGVLFGVMAGIPTALLLMAHNRVGRLSASV
ncbi:MAG: hypothetical protein H6644_17570 [Caldilineaceae bacterium]|nr:hypothetical protein [Caldilineaceae bacterium]